jgi:sulfur-carrier protein
MIRILIPIHLRVLAKIPEKEISLSVDSPATINSILDALEQKYPNLKGTIRDHGTTKRRPMIRFYALNEDLSHDPTDQPLPEKIASGAEPFYIIAAIAGG